MNGYLQHDWWVWVPYIVTTGGRLFESYGKKSWILVRFLVDPIVSTPRTVWLTSVYTTLLHSQQFIADYRVTFFSWNYCWLKLRIRNNVFFRLGFFSRHYLPFFVPYKDLLCFLLATPWVSRLPLRMWYLTPGKSLTLPPLINTTECSCKLWP